MSPRSGNAFALSLILAVSASACFETRGTAWMQQPLLPDDSVPPQGGQGAAATSAAARPPRSTSPSALPGGAPTDDDVAPSPRSSGRLLGVFHNTYYSFPDESEYDGERTTLFDARCKAIASVPKTFHDKLCVQGSGRLADHRTVSFAKRDCACAALCPRSSQKICYDALDPVRFPWGRGATGAPITPFRTIAVDTSVIPLGTRVFIPAFVGIPVPGGGLHDGCFVAQDRGLKVVGRSVDIYTGSESATSEWNHKVATATGLELYVDEPRCAEASP